MSVHVVELIDREIERLQTARAVLAGEGKKIAAAVESAGPTLVMQTRRSMSDAGRAAVAAAQKLRWKKLKGTAKKSAQAA